jgi:hypothetical protein
MRYGLLVTTHGDAPHLPETLTSFERWVTPDPVVRLAVVDGPDALLPSTVQPGGPWWTRQAQNQYGFCVTVRTGWDLARDAIAEHRLDYVFWLENDFRFFRPVQVDLMAYAIGRFRHLGLSQMSLLRQPVNEREIIAGSVLPTIEPAPVQHMGWIAHSGYFTTNPSLIPAWLFDFDWPEGPECEGKMGLRLRDAGLTFGIWGEGDEWVEHLGTRNGKGY